MKTTKIEAKDGSKIQITEEEMFDEDTKVTTVKVIDGALKAAQVLERINVVQQQIAKFSSELKDLMKSKQELDNILNNAVTSAIPEDNGNGVTP